MNEQILINYTKTEDSYLLAIVVNGKSKVFSEETEETMVIIDQLKEIVEE